MFTAESDGERILKIGQHLVKSWATVGCAVFIDSWSNKELPGRVNVGRQILNCIWQTSKREEKNSNAT